MTTQERIHDLEIAKNAKYEMLDTIYDDLANNLPCNEAGETCADAVLELNEWYEMKKAQIWIEYIRKCKAV